MIQKVWYDVNDKYKYVMDDVDDDILRKIYVETKD